MRILPIFQIFEPGFRAASPRSGASPIPTVLTGPILRNELPGQCSGSAGSENRPTMGFPAKHQFSGVLGWNMRIVKNIKKTPSRLSGFLRKEAGKNFKFLLQFQSKSGIIHQRGLKACELKNHTPGDRVPMCPACGAGSAG